MRISAAGLASTMAVAIDQILRLAPSISGPIEPVVSSTKATSTIGSAAACVAEANGARQGVRQNARASALVTFPIMFPLQKRFSDAPRVPFHRGWRGPELRLTTGGLAAGV